MAMDYLFIYLVVEIEMRLVGFGGPSGDRALLEPVVMFGCLLMGRSYKVIILYLLHVWNFYQRSISICD